MAENTLQELVVLGAGFIGLSFAATFQAAGWRVTLADPDATRRDAAQAGIAAQHRAIELAGLPAVIGPEVTVVEMPDAALARAALVLECGPEQLATKQRIFSDLLAKAGPKAVLATASSAIPMSQILPGRGDQARCLVAHPVNPPAVLRVVELVPAPGTLPRTVQGAERLFTDAGFTPVTLGHEIEGFVMNRLQGAVLREAYRLVEDGIVGAEGVDTIMRMALGPRWALSGPFETAELNTPGGIRAHAARMGPAYKRMGEARGERVDWSPDLVAKVDRERRALCPEDDLPRQAAWRSGAVARLVALRDQLLGARDV